MTVSIAQVSTIGEPADPRIAGVVEVYNRVERYALGSPVTALSERELSGLLRENHHRRVDLIVAETAGAVVGYASLVWNPEPDAVVGSLYGGVVSEHRRHGIGTALLTGIETLAAERGCGVLQMTGVHGVGDAPFFVAQTGMGEVSRADPGVRFLNRHGYALEQIHRLSVLPLPLEPEQLGAMLRAATGACGANYRSWLWQTPHPERWVGDFARLKSRMATDAPSGNLVVTGDDWDIARVRRHEQDARDAGSIHLTAAVEHIPTGRLVAFSALALPDDRTQPVRQGPTLVLREHRGYRLGMLAKVTNLDQLARVSPSSAELLTDNAAENRHMLAINNELGFKLVGFRGAWQKTLHERTTCRDYQPNH